MWRIVVWTTLKEWPSLHQVAVGGHQRVIIIYKAPVNGEHYVGVLLQWVDGIMSGTCQKIILS